MRYMAVISYDGTNYVGWQWQKNGVSIQEVLEKAMKETFNTEVECTASGRTDAGVHAEGQVIHFDVETNIPADKIPFSVNNHLPSDISLQEKYHDLFINKVFYTKAGEKALEENDMDDKSQITFNWHFLPSLIIEIRNGFCHYLNTERPNLLDVKDFIDSDIFFNLINNECMKWISTVFVSILAESYSNMM